MLYIESSAAIHASLQTVGMDIHMQRKSKSSPPCFLFVPAIVCVCKLLSLLYKCQSRDMPINCFVINIVLFSIN
jgi:hypothetical protein